MTVWHDNETIAHLTIEHHTDEQSIVLREM